jgi:vesicle coat complex subunit
MITKKEMEVELKRVERSIASYVYPSESDSYSLSKSYDKGKRDAIKEILAGSWR